MSVAGSTPSPGTVPLRALPPTAYRRMALVLRVGLVTSLAIVFAGLAVYVIRYGTEPYGNAVAPNPILNYLSLPGLVAGLAGGHIEAYLTLGLLVLIATPIVRVASGFYYFERGHERWMAGITLTVLLLLLLGILVLGPLLR